MKYDVYQGLFIWPQKKTLNLHLTYFVETLYSASPQTNKKNSNSVENQSFF